MRSVIFLLQDDTPMYPLIAASYHFLSLGTKKSFADMSEYFTLTVSGLCENLSEL